MMDTIADTVEMARDLNSTPEGPEKEDTASPGRKSSFMDRLSEADRRALAARGSRKWYATGTVICQEGDPGESLYIIESGEVAVLKEMNDGRSTLLGYRGPGEILGENSLVSQQPRFASIIAAEDSELLCLLVTEFSALMNKYPGINWAILNVLNDRLHAADTARTAITLAEEKLQHRVKRLTTEAERQADLARLRQEAIELIAHDLRTPMTVIDGCLQMLLAAEPSAALASSADIVELAAQSSKRLSSLLDALLETARQEEPGLALAYQPVDLAELIESAVSSVQAIAASDEIDLEWQVPPGLPQPLGDADKLERVVLNLLENALSYTPAGGHVLIAAKARDREIEVSVTDTGPGVPAQYRETIFERFARVPGTIGRRKGFGLGLYFCRQIMQAHSGRIRVEPGPNHVGSRFVFTLALEREQDRG
jgi:signal transduction histidine kinase